LDKTLNNLIYVKASNKAEY